MSSMSLTCNQVNALLSFYINDKLNDQLKSFVKKHLAECPACRARYEALKNVMTSLRDAHKEIDEKVRASSASNPFSTEHYIEFKKKLSAYVDNELSDAESLRIKKYAISNPLARADLENMYTLKKLLHESFDKSKIEFKDDFSKFVMNQLDFKHIIQNNESILNLVSLLIIATIMLAFGAIIVFWV